MANRSRGWCLTLNNYTEDDELVCYDIALMCKYCVFGKEVGESGTAHLQGFVYFDTLKSFDQIQLLFDGRAHLERMQGTPKQASDYCKKDGDFFEYGQLPLSDREKGERGKQSIEERWTLAKAGRFEELPPEQIKTYQFIHARYTQVHDREQLDNMWIWGQSGCGKSSYIRQNYDMSTVYWKGMNKWWDGYQHEPVVVLEDMDPKHGEFIAYFLKIWADHYAFNAEVKGGMMRIRPKTIIVTSQYPLNEVFPDLKDQEALFRRFKIKTWDNMFKCFV